MYSHFILRKPAKPGKLLHCILVLSFLLTGVSVKAKNYYFSSSSGSDSYTSTQAQNQATPWKSIAKLNSFFNSLVAGDNIYFKRGDTFYGCITVTKSGASGNLITISAYGTGNKPVISGLITLSSWSLVSGGIYQAAAPNVKNTVNLVTLNGSPKAVGRFPNADAANGGYLTYESYSGTSSITDNQLTSATNWTNAEVVIRKQHYALEKCKITSHINTVINYSATASINPLNNANPSPIAGTNGYGYFIQRDLRTLDQLGEWYFNTTTKNMQMYFGSSNPSSNTVRVSTLDTLINIGTRNYININNIALEGANAAAIYAANAGNLTIQSCDMNLMGGKGLIIFNSPNILIDGINTNNVLCGAIDVTSRYQNNATIRNCTIKNTGMVAGMGSFWDDNDYKAISVTVGSGALIENNNIDHTGFVGIQFQGNSVMVQKNFVNYYDIVKDDGGGIYTYQSGTDASPGTTYTNRTIQNNIVMNGVGASIGTTSPVDVDGIFLDGRTTNVNILNNSIANIGVNGIYANNPHDVNIRGNTCFNNGSAIGITKYSWGSISNLSIKRNIFYPKYGIQNNFNYVNTGVNVPVVTTIQAAMQNMGQIDSNTIATPNATAFNYYYSLVEGDPWIFPKPLSFEGWKSFTGHDKASKITPKIASYKVNSLIGLNVVTNGQFTSNITGITTWSLGTFSAAWDNTGKITGTGSLKITPLVASNNFTLIYGSVGAVSSSKKYILRFTTLGSAVNGTLNTYIRKSASPYTVLTPVQKATFGTSRIAHEFLFTAPTTEAAASFMIEIQQTSGTTYIDDIAFYEADATVLNIDDQLRFEYNATNVIKTITLDAKYVGADSTVYNGSISLPPYTSAVLLKSGIIETNLTADAGGDISLVLPINTAILKGSTTGDITKYYWTKITGPDQYAIINPTNASTEINNLTAGKYTFQYKVINGQGDSAFDMVNVIVTSVLPVTLIDFSAKNNDDKIALRWQVASEINISQYLVERSNNGQNFENIGQLNSNGLTNIQPNYEFVDNFPSKGINYYRLVMIDKDGSMHHSKTISVSVKNAPSFTLINLSLSGINANIKLGINSNFHQVLNLVVADVSGRILFKRQAQLQKGFNSIDKKTPSLNTGVYYVKLFTNDQFITKTVLSGY